MTITIDESHENLFDQNKPIEEMLPFISDIDFWRVCDRHYIVNKHFHGHFYPPGQVLPTDKKEKHKFRLLTRAKENNRNEKLNRTNLRESVRDRGLTMRGRGRPVVCVPLGDLWHELHREILAAGHVLEGAYDADDEYPDNHQVQVTMAQGVEDMVEFRATTPPAIKTKIVTLQNEIGRAHV